MTAIPSSVPASRSIHVTSSPPAAILFDLDGTLVDTWRLYMECYRRALEPHLGYAPADAEIAARFPGSERGLLTGWIGEAAGAASHAEMLRLYAELHASFADGIYEGVREMLAALRGAGYPLGIVTGKGRGAWTVTEAQLDLGPFHAVVTDDDVHACKPDPAGLLAAVAALGIAPEQAVYVGDSTSDLRAGRAAGMRVGAVLWPKTAPGERDAFIRAAEELRPEWIFARPADVTRAFAGWC
jgi:HAD superfamily hydrolase (TIGR01509 family)